MIEHNFNEYFENMCEEIANDYVEENVAVDGWYDSENDDIYIAMIYCYVVIEVRFDETNAHFDTEVLREEYLEELFRHFQNETYFHLVFDSFEFDFVGEIEAKLTDAVMRKIMDANYISFNEKRGINIA